MAFTHLHVHSEYSLLDGLSRIPAMVTRAKDLGMTALGITDHGSMYGVVEFYSACKEAGIKPVIGSELYVAKGQRFDRRPGEKSPSHLTVLAKDNVGYRNLMKLSSKAHIEGFYYKPRVDHELLEEHADGLIVLSGCPSSELSVALMDGNYEEAKEIARWYMGTFPNFYLEMQRHTNLDFLDRLNEGLLRLGRGPGHPAHRHERLALRVRERSESARRAAVHRHQLERQRSESIPVLRPLLLPEE